MVNKERLINTFLSLGAISSPSKQEKPIADVLVKELGSLGFDVVVDNAGKKVGGNTGNVIATKKGSVEGARQSCSARIWIPFPQPKTGVMLWRATQSARMAKASLGQMTRLESLLFSKDWRS